MLALWSFLVFGLVLGMRHATDPDHVVAVGAIVAQKRTLRAAAPVGALWGLGHAVTVLVVGGAIVLFGLAIPPRLGLGLEFAVGLMLVLVGGQALLRPERHAAGAHGHPHRFDGAFWRPIVVGLMHGLAGSAAVALVALARVDRPGWALAYLAVFGLGTIVGMLLVTVGMALPIAVTGARFSRAHRFVGVAAAVLSVIVGGLVAYETGVERSLFGASPSWTPE